MRTCQGCGRDLQPGEFIRCDPCVRDWQHEHGIGLAHVTPPPILGEPPYRRVAGAKVPLDELPSAEDVS